MPFKSKRQWRAAFSGRIPGVDPHEWAHETKAFSKLPDRAPAEKGKPTLRSKSAEEDRQMLQKAAEAFDGLEDGLTRVFKVAGAEQAFSRSLEMLRGRMTPSGAIPSTFSNIKKSIRPSMSMTPSTPSLGGGMQNIRPKLGSAIDAPWGPLSSMSAKGTREWLKTHPTAGREKGIWGRTKQILTGRRIEPLKKVRDSQKDTIPGDIVEATAMLHGAPKSQIENAFEEVRKGTKGELLRERLKTHGSRAGIAGGTVGAGYLAMRPSKRSRNRR